MTATKIYPVEILYNKDGIPTLWRSLLSKLTRRIED